jgi:MarR family transcriptional regulator, 2-MHQ and catechol-resistance regulon repressor
MVDELEKQARELHQVVTELVKRYQFRDRQEVCCHGISVSQCYALAALEEEETLAMGELAGKMQLSVSTMTRVVDQLVAKELVERCVDEQDRRVCCVLLTGKGSELLGTIHGELLEMEKGILEQIGAKDSQNLIAALKMLIEGVDEWRRKGSENCC